MFLTFRSIFKQRALTLTLFSLLLTGLMLTACGEETPTSATNQSPATTSQANNPLPTTSATTTKTSATAGQTANGSSASATKGNNPGTGASSTGQPLTGIDPAQFVDNRSDALSLIASYYNAINRKEYVRAYSYWQNPGGNKAGVPQSYDLFAQGYAKTASVQLTTGTVTADAGAGQRYYNVPVTIQAKNSDGTSQSFVGCYTAHQAVPTNFGAPPFEPLGIATAKVQPVAANANTSQLLSQVCQAGAASNPTQAVPANDTAAGATYYLDDRSTASEVLRSFYNAINRKEYVRAYYYWENPGTSATSQPPDYADFAKGYADTASVELTTGQALTEGAAGTIYYRVPVVLKATHSDGKTQSFVGCYTLKQPQPANFGAPPFQPISISAGALKVSTGSPAIAPANQVCQ